MTGPPTMTYASLQETCKSFLERGLNPQDTGVLLYLPQAIANAQRSLSNLLKIQGYVYSLTGTLTTGSSGSVLAKPEGWRDTISINFGLAPDFASRRGLQPRSYEYIRSVYPDPTVLDAPVYYADYDLQHWFLAPSPAADYPFEAMVHRLPALLSDSNQQNFLTQYAPNLILYTTLGAMESYLKDDERIGTWKALAKAEFDALDAEDLRRMVDRGSFRSTN